MRGAGEAKGGSRTAIRYGVLPITEVRGSGDRLEAHVDHVWLLMPFQAQAETRMLSGELVASQVEADDNNDAARSGISGGSKGSKGSGLVRAPET